MPCTPRRHGNGGHVEVSLLESILDAQFELLTTFLNDGLRPPRRSAVNNANAYLGAPYGIYKTADGFMALAMGSIPRLGELLGCPRLAEFSDPKTWFERRDDIKRILAEHLTSASTSHWLGILEPADVWCADVFTWSRLVEHEAFRSLDMLQEIRCRDGSSMTTVRCPIRIDGSIFKSDKGAPRVGQDTEAIRKELEL